MKNYIGYSANGQIVFATQTPAAYDFEAPEGMEIVDVDAGTYASIAPTVGQLKFRAAAGAFVPIPDSPGEFYTWDWPTHSWIQDRALAEKSVRAKRGGLLTASDWTQLPDVPLGTKSAWADCRQALRDITDQAGFPFNVIWPTVPQQ